MFGSTERRFVQQTNLKTPGPGYYNNENNYGLKEVTVKATT